MKLIEQMGKHKQLEILFMGWLQKELDVPFAFDTTENTIKLLSLRKEVHCKYAASDAGVYYFYFTKALLEELKIKAHKHDNAKHLCVALFCEESEQPCILTYPELQNIVERVGRDDYTNLTVKINKRTFTVASVSDGGLTRCELLVSKKSSMAKLRK